MNQGLTDAIENEYVSIYFKDGIIFASYQPNFKMDIGIAKKTILYRKEVSAGRGDLPLLADVRNLKAVTDDARELLAGEDGHKGLLAVAVLTNNPIQNLLANFYLKLSKPPIPTQLFTDKDKALRWLNLYLQRN